MIGAWDRVCDKLAESGYASLSPDEQLWVDVRGFIDAVDNGGLVSYFYNSRADRVRECVQALDRLGAEQARDLLLEGCRHFSGGVPRSTEARNRTINSWPSAVTDGFEELDESLAKLIPSLESDLEQHVSRFAVAT